MDFSKLNFDRLKIMETRQHLYEMQKEIEQRWWDLHDQLKQGYDSQREQREAMREQSELYELLEELGAAKSTLQKLSQHADG